MNLPVVEVFGPTIQGEGPYAGRNADFIRLGGCNLSCAWCDTPYSWDGRRFDLRSEITPTPVPEILNSIARQSGIVVVTGGEPLLYAHTAAFEALVTGIVAQGRDVHIETNGTILPPNSIAAAVSVFVVSPKLANARLGTRDGSSQLHRGWADIADLTEVHLKIVCEDVSDVRAAVLIADEAGLPRSRLWVMPEAADRTTVARRFGTIADAAAREGVNATSRLHLLAWDAERGR
jgi:organic radical activating enzyme